MWTETGGQPTEDVRYLAKDNLGSNAAIVSSDGTLLQRQRFSPFGQRIDSEGDPFHRDTHQ